MNVPSVDPSSAAAAKEPEAKPLVSDKYEYVTITDGAVILSGKQYNLSEIKDVSIQTANGKPLLLCAAWLHQRTSMCFHHLWFLYYLGTIATPGWTPTLPPFIRLSGFSFWCLAIGHQQHHGSFSDFPLEVRLCRKAATAGSKR